MTGTYSKSMLKQTLAPVALVVTIWVTMSLTTSYYIQWIERSNQRVFVENVASVRAAESLQIIVWRLAAECPEHSIPSSETRLQWKDGISKIASERKTLGDTAILEEEQAQLLKMDPALTEFVEIIHRLLSHKPNEDVNNSQIRELSSVRHRLIELGREVSLSATRIFEINQTLVHQYRAQRQRVNNFLLWGRFLTLLIGPILGVLLGWRLALRLHRSIARIAVTLHDVGSNSDSDIGVVDLLPSGDIAHVQQKAEQFAERMRKVSSDLQSAKREVLQSERLAAVGELAAGVAHEIRNPLTSVKLLLQHAVRQASGPTLDESKLRLILEEIGRMETTIQGLLDFSRPPKLNRIPHDLRQTLRRALNLFDARARQQGIEITTHVDDTPLIVDGDTEKLHQVLVNLLINAVEAMPDGGSLSIKASITAKPISLTGNAASGVNNGKNGRSVQIVMQDTGEGIANEVLPRLFQPFATTKERGTGLGLAVSRRIIEEHNGTIRACNGPNGGALFTINIPLVETTVSTRAS